MVQFEEEEEDDEDDELDDGNEDPDEDDDEDDELDDERFLVLFGIVLFLLFKNIVSVFSILSKIYVKQFIYSWESSHSFSSVLICIDYFLIKVFSNGTRKYRS